MDSIVQLIESVSSMTQMLAMFELWARSAPDWAEEVRLASECILIRLTMHGSYDVARAGMLLIHMFRLGAIRHAVRPHSEVLW